MGSMRNLCRGVAGLSLLLVGGGLAHAADMTLFSVLPGSGGGQDYHIKLQILFFMTLLGLLPSLLLMMTSFTRIIIVLAILRQALGLQSSPPNRVLLGIALTASTAAMRDVAHQISDAVYEKILGVPGAFWTRIAYVSASGLGRDTRYALIVSDADGFNPHTVVTSNEPLLSPAWSPDGQKLAYVSFEGGNSGIWIQDVATAAREKLTSFRGINGAPSFSPDGTRLAMSLSKGGNPDIYVMNLGSRHLTQVTNQLGIDTEPTWSADGASLYFTSDRGGRPQVYQVPAGGGGATRISFDGSYNASPSVSFDGKKIATAQGAGNVYRIALMDRSTGSPRWSMLSPGSLDESPSFAPNGSMLVYAAREGRNGVLYTVSADGRVRQRLVTQSGSDVREPAWSPYRRKPG